MSVESGNEDRRPVPIDLTRHADMVEGAREFVRLWMRPDGATASFINPVPVGPDPAAFGAAIVDCIRQAARTYARAVNISEDEALERLWHGLDAERDARRSGPLPIVRRPDDAA